MRHIRGNISSSASIMAVTPPVVMATAAAMIGVVVIGVVEAGNVIDERIAAGLGGAVDH